MQRCCGCRLHSWMQRPRFQTLRQHIWPLATAVFTSAHMHIPTQPHSGNLGTAATLRPNRPLWEQRGEGEEEGEGEGQVGGAGGSRTLCLCHPINKHPELLISKY